MSYQLCKTPLDTDVSLSFDDVLLVPQYSDIESRLEPNVGVWLNESLYLDIPILSTNMSTVTEHEMMVAIGQFGSIGLLHRFLSTESLRQEIEKAFEKGCTRWIPSIGVKEEDRALIDFYFSFDKPVTNPVAILVDIAHGECAAMERMVRYLRDNLPSDVLIIAGNVATRDGADFLLSVGAHSVRAGIGGGSHCSTRTVTGHGIPTLQSVIEINRLREKFNFGLIADGGFRTSGDIVKALAFGADCVSLGYMLGGTSASPGIVYSDETGYHKKMYGMSSKTAADTLRGGKKRGIASEGIETTIPYKGDTQEVLEEIVGGIKSGLSYSGANDLFEFRNKAKYTVLAVGGMKESKLL